MFEVFPPSSLSVLFLLIPLCLGAVQETDWVEVFRAGEYPQGTYTAADVQAVADRYDPDHLEAPVTTDHRQTGPAFGWVEDVKAEGKKLLVKFKDLTEQMAEAINEGLFKNRSVELFEDLDGEGPYLKAVSFLGAQTPQVKGLEPIGEIQFSEEHLAEASASFAYRATEEERHDEMGALGDRLESLKQEQDMTFEELSEAMQGEGARDASTLASIFNGEIEDPPDEVLESLAGVFGSVSAEELGELRAEQGGTAYAQADGDGEDVDVADVDTFAELKQTVAQMQAELQSERDRRREAEERADAAEEQSREEAFEQFMEERVPPAVRPQARAVFAALQQDHVTFAQGAEDVDAEDPAEAFKSLLAAFDHEDLFEEVASEEPDADGSSNDTSEFTEAVRQDMTERGAL